MNWYCKTPKEVQEMLKTDINKGLSNEEANRRLKQYGENRLKDGTKKRNLIMRFLAQLNDFLVVILISAAVVSFVVPYIQGEKDFVDSLIILAIVMLNAVLGLVQEDRAEKAIEDLKKLSANTARVLRSGKTLELDSSLIVPGDVIIISTGDYICADSRLITSIGLKAEEATLTGESLPVEKSAEEIFKEDTPLGDRRNMVLSTTFVTYGKGKAIVTSTGMDTEVGKIAGLIMADEKSHTPLQKKLDETGKVLGISAIIVCLIIFAIGLLREMDPFSMFMTSISLAVAAIPEGLPAIVTIVLAIGMQRMSKKNTIIRRLPAVETLGGAQVICSDKTGTLTQNKMKVISIKDCSEANRIADDKKKFILKLSVLCNDSILEDGKYIGEATEIALLKAAEENGENKDIIEKNMPRINEIPFSSERKLMTTVHRLENGKYISITKGAPDILFERCDKYLDQIGVITDFSNANRCKYRSGNAEMAKSALRVIAIAYKEMNTLPKKMIPDEMECGLIFTGLIGMIDPPRPEAKKAVSICKKSGIKPVMITGDHVLTAIAIAKEIGIYKDGDLYMTGAELERISQDDLSKTINRYSVFARVSPSHKVRIVRAFQNNNKVVAMTGDGVNDAPALKAADIGCAMGRAGTDVAKSASDMILVDDNFATIVEAVKEGRSIYDNIKKAVHFLLSSNIGEIITILVAMCFGWQTPLLPIQLLWVNLVTDSLPAIALGFDPSDDDIMERKPQSNQENMFSHGLGMRIALEGCIIGMLALIAFAVGHVYFDNEVGYITGRTMAFAVLSISQLVHAFNMRSEYSIFSINILGNAYLVIAFIVGLIMQVSVIMIPPIAKVFLVASLNTEQWIIVGLLSIVPILVVEAEKFVQRKSADKTEGLIKRKRIS